MAAFDHVMMEIDGGVATVTLNRPEKLNAFDRAMCDDVVEALRQVTESSKVRALVLTGTGRAFCAGADLAVLAEDGEWLVAAGKEIALLIRGARQPVLAAVNGAAAGGGANLALACDYRLASESAQIGRCFTSSAWDRIGAGVISCRGWCVRPPRSSWCGALAWFRPRKHWPSDCSIAWCPTRACSRKPAR